MTVTLSLGEGEEEVLNFVRAKLSLLLDWDDPSSPTFGFSDAMRRCDLPLEEATSSLLSELWASLHHSKNTVLLDQVALAARRPRTTRRARRIRCPHGSDPSLRQALLLFPLVLLGGYQMGGASSSLAILLAAAYCVLLCVRLKYTGALS